MGCSIEFFWILTSHVGRSLGKKCVLLFPHCPQKQSTLKVKRGLKTLRALALGHFGQRVDKSPVYEDDFGVSLLVYEKSRFEETWILRQISHFLCFAFVY